MLTHAQTEYADESEIGSLEEDFARARRKNVDQAQRMVYVIE